MKYFLVKLLSFLEMSPTHAFIYAYSLAPTPLDTRSRTDASRLDTYILSNAIRVISCEFDWSIN